MVQHAILVACPDPLQSPSLLWLMHPNPSCSGVLQLTVYSSDLLWKRACDWNDLYAIYPIANACNWLNGGTEVPRPHLKVGQCLWWNLHSRIPHYIMMTLDSPWNYQGLDSSISPSSSRYYLFLGFYSKELQALALPAKTRKVYLGRGLRMFAGPNNSGKM